MALGRILLRRRVIQKVSRPDAVRASPPHPFRAMAMPRLYDRVVPRIREPAKQLPGAGIAMASLEYSAEPVRRAASHGDLGVRMKARNRASAFLRIQIEQRVRPRRRVVAPIAQHPAILVALAATAVSA